MSKNYCAKCDSIKNRLLRFGNTQDYASVVLKSKDVVKYRDTDVSVYRTIVDENRNHMEDIALIISKQLGISQRSVERAFAALKEKGILEREGGTRGIWIVKK